MDWFTHYEDLLKALSRVEDRAQAEEYLAACRTLGKAVIESSGEMTLALAQNALDKGATKKAIAEALGVSPSTLTGMKKTNAPRAKAKPKAMYLDIDSGDWVTR